MPAAVRQLLGIASILLVAAGSLAVSEVRPPFGLPGSAGPAPLSEDGDPIHVFYPRGPCRGSHIELQLWEREMRRWVPHPEHVRVPVESCQIEDAGFLLNELRWRCDEPDGRAPWNVGLDVFDPAITESCQVGELRSSDYRIDIHVSSPTRSTVVRSPDRMTTLRGSIRIDGLEGVAYDVMLVLDRSGSDARAAERLAAQIRAARQLVGALEPRLGAVRIGLASYPNPEPPQGESHKGRLELPLTSDAALLRHALDRVASRGLAGRPAFADGLEHGLNQLLLLSDGDRPAARRVLVVAADGRAAPFVSSDEQQPVLFMRLDSLAAELRRSGVRLHVLALGGYAERPTPLVNDLVARSLGHFTRIPWAERTTSFFERVSLPLPSELYVTSPLLGSRHSARVDADGQFEIEVPLAGGLNRLRLQARTSNDLRQERDWIVEFDESQYLKLVLDAERRRASEKRVQQRKELDVGVELPPEVGAGPP